MPYYFGFSPLETSKIAYEAWPLRFCNLNLPLARPIHPKIPGDGLPACPAWAPNVGRLVYLGCKPSEAAFQMLPILSKGPNKD